MPQEASTLEREAYLRPLVLGYAKTGKTTACIDSLVRAFGKGYVLVCSGDKTSLAPAQRRTSKFAFDIIKDEADFEACLKEARRGVKEGEYKWILVDDFSLYASWLAATMQEKSASQNQKGEADGRRFWPEVKSRLMNIPRRLFDLKAHIIFVSHYIEPSQEIDGQKAKSGRGIMPMIPGSAREELPALFPDVIFMEKLKDGRRVFQVNPEGVWGPGCRNVEGSHTIDPDFGVFWKMTKETAATAKGVKR